MSWSNWEDWVISLALIVLVLRQIRGRQISLSGLLWPVGLVAWAAFDYLREIPSHTADWLFTAGLAVVGLGLGIACGVLTDIFAEGGKVIARARKTAAVLWIAGMGSRLVFGVVALHGGGAAIGRLSDHLGLQSAGTWPTALIVMALAEVLSRTAIMFRRYKRVEVTAKAQAEHEQVASTMESATVPRGA